MFFGFFGARQLGFVGHIFGLAGAQVSKGARPGAPDLADGLGFHALGGVLRGILVLQCWSQRYRPQENHPLKVQLRRYIQHETE
jgi:hypothetical protein